MFDSASQRELHQGLQMWLEVRGLCLVTGPCGVGKSITLRRFFQELDDARYRVVGFAYLPCTVYGFLRSLSRSLGLPIRLHTTDLFDAAKTHLATHEQERGSHPIIIIDDAEGIRAPVLDTLRRLTSHALESEDRFSILLSGTDTMPSVLNDPQLASLRSRILYTCALRPFGLDDTVNYVRFHLQRADIDPGVMTDAAVKRLFQASQGYPRNINQLAIQSLIQAAVRGLDKIDGDFMTRIISVHPLYQNQGVER